MLKKIAILVVVCISMFVLESQAHILRRLYDELAMDSRSHYLPCDVWPTLEQVEKVLKEHQADIEKIEQINPGHTEVEIDPMTCPGKADLTFWYPSHQERLEIEKIINGDTFYGVLYNLINR